MQLAFDLGVTPSYAADDFILSAANEDACEWLQRWPDQDNAEAVPDARAYACILAGPAASGKSHLAHMWAERTGARWLGSSLTDAEGDIRADSTELAALQQSAAPLLVLDGLDSHARALPERLLFHLLNTVRERDGHLLLTTRTPPAQLVQEGRITLPDLRSRLLALPLLSIRAPDDALLLAVLAKHCSDRGLSITPDVLAYIGPRMERSFAGAQALAARLDHEALARGRAITLAIARTALEPAGG